MKKIIGRLATKADLEKRGNVVVMSVMPASLGMSGRSRANMARSQKESDERAMADAELLDAYRSTRYIIDAAPAPITLRIGHRSPEADSLLTANRATVGVFLTAWNPQSRVLSADENNARQASLVALLNRDKLAFLPGRGVGADAAWEPEESVFIFDADDFRSHLLAGEFDQRAFVRHRLGAATELVVSDFTRGERRYPDVIDP